MGFHMKPSKIFMFFKKTKNPVSVLKLKVDNPLGVLGV